MLFRSPIVLERCQLKKKKNNTHNLKFENYVLFSRLTEDWASLVAQMVKNPLAMQEAQAQSLGQENPLEKGMATHSSILAWRIPWAEEPGGLQSMGSQSQMRVPPDATVETTHNSQGDPHLIKQSTLSPEPQITLYVALILTKAINNPIK